MEGAQRLRGADSSGVACSCRVSRVVASPELKTQTCQVISGQVTWNLDSEVVGYVVGDNLEFSVHSAGRPIGIATLRSDQFFPYGFGVMDTSGAFGGMGLAGGQLTLRGSGTGIAGLLLVRVEVLAEEQ